MTTFKVGDRVFASTSVALGCYVEYKCLREDAAIALIPANVSDDEAAALSFGGATALRFLAKGKVITRGEKVLVNGASGAVGSAAVQLAKHFGADVTGVCNTDHVARVKAIGADRVIDYTKEDFTADGSKYDVIVDTAGTAPFARSKRSLNRKGRLLDVGGTLSALLSVPWVSLTSDKRLIAGPVSGTADDLRFLAQLAELGEFKPCIDRSFPFAQIVDAHRYFESGHKTGTVVITVAESAMHVV